MQTVYVASTDQAFLAASQEAARSLGLAVSIVADPNKSLPVSQGNERFWLFLDVSDNTVDLTNIARFSGYRLVLVGEPESHDPIALITRLGSVNHVYIKNRQQMTHQLQSIMQNMKDRCWGLGCYLSAGAKSEKLLIADYGKKLEHINQIREFAVGVPNGFSDLPDVAATIAWEMIMNGLFNAPRVGGKPKYKDVSRSSALVVEPGEEMELEFGYDDKILAISASDPFGTLTRETVVANLARASKTDQAQVMRSTPGAGVGLYVLFTSASQLDFRIASGSRTEVTAVIYLSKRYRDFARGGHSINFFYEESKRP